MSQDNAGELTLIVKTGEIWRSDQLCNYQAQNQDYALAHPIYNLLEHGGGGGAVAGRDSPVDPGQQDLHDTGQQWDVQKETQ